MKTNYKFLPVGLFALLFSLFAPVTTQAAPPQLINCALYAISTGAPETQVIGGIVMGPGTGQSQILIRAVGPGLATVSAIPNPLKSIKIAVYEGSVNRVNRGTLGSGFSSDADIVTRAGVAAGAFPIPSTGSDSAVVIFVNPNTAYTVIVTSTDGKSTGPVLFEAYILPPNFVQ